MSNLIAITSGKINRRTDLTECYVFYVPTAASPIGQVEAFASKAARDFRGMADAPVRTHGSVLVLPSLTDTPAEIGGNYASVTLAIAEGAVLKIMMRTKTGWNSPWRNATFFIRCRSGAALRKVTCSLPRGNNIAVPGGFSVFGRFDFLTADEAVGLGVRTNAYSIEHSRIPDMSIVTVETIEAEASAPVTVVKTSEGNSMPVVKRRRAIESI